jgi:chromate reductase, NAD(P)H dehydrogenase (quinone)
VRILGISGSLQRQSSNAMLLEVAASAVPAGVTLEIFDGLRHLPHFDPGIENEGSAPASVAALRRAVAECDALLIASPEYGHSLPGSLKNAIDWLIGSGELESKLVAVTAAVPAKERGQRGLKALRDTLAAVSARIVGGEPLVRGPQFEQDVARLVATLVQAGRA